MSRAAASGEFDEEPLLACLGRPVRAEPHPEHGACERSVEPRAQTRAAAIWRAGRPKERRRACQAARSSRLRTSSRRPALDTVARATRPDARRDDQARRRAWHALLVALLLLLSLRHACCCVRPVRVWLDTALQQHQALLLAPPVLDGLGTQPKRLFLEFLASTLLCVAGIPAWGCSRCMPHPQHDPRSVIHWSRCRDERSRRCSRPPPSSGASSPRSRGSTPWWASSLVQWCDCMNWREESRGHGRGRAPRARAHVHRAAAPA